MTEQERKIIYRFAAGDQSLRAAAVSIYRALLSARLTNRRDSYVAFMAEVDTPSPDLVLRAKYRAQVLAQNP